MSASPLLLITGASGYVGGRLLDKLSRSGCRLRAMARNPETIQERWGRKAEVVQGDVLDPQSLPKALAGVDTAYYLIHAMGGGDGFEEREADSARHFGHAAKEAGVKRIIFLGGLCEDSETLSPHMRSRHETGRILRESGLPVLEFRASIILGAGSLSFEMIRALVQRLPLMITPKWVYVEAQPIYIEDLLLYLDAARTIDLPQSVIYEIGGADVVTYKTIMSTFAQHRGLKRTFIPVPFLSPYLSSLWLGLVTPLFARVGRKLIESVTHPSVIHDHAAAQAFSVKPLGVDDAIRLTLEEEEKGFATTRWSDSLSSGNTHRTWAGVRFGTRLVDSRCEETKASPEVLFKTLCAIGGDTGWYYANFLWRIRGAVDEILGGVGMRRGRRHPQDIRAGEVIDCWRVEKIEVGKRLRLKAEMKLPGRAWLEFEIHESDEEHTQTTLRQTAVFDPQGLSGLLYWYGIYPVHVLIFKGMLRNLLKTAENNTSDL
ncbi:SDR family oxidoreductase [Kiritimatiellota bacterium B12222]|nr:SDR family oxidoreductase [Kiritimatiellota bacterium B12222]